MNCDELEEYGPIWQQIRENGVLDKRKVHLFDSVDSTNSRALEYGKAGAASGTVILAETQTKGRGRLGKSWQSPVGSGLYFSVILRPRLLMKDLAKVTMTAGLAVCKSLEESVGVSPKIKWPNDILVSGKKLAGILTESDSLHGDEVPFVVVGIGLNVNTPLTDFPEELRHKVTSLAASGDRNYDKGAILGGILRLVDLEIRRLERGRFSEILVEWRRRDATYGRVLNWLSVSGKLVSGVSLGPDEEGILIIRDKHKKTHKILSGDLTLGKN